MPLVGLGAIFSRGFSIYLSRILPIILVQLISGVLTFLVGRFGLRGVLYKITSLLELTPKELATPGLLQQAIQYLNPEQLIDILLTPGLWLAIIINFLVYVLAQAGVMLAIYPNSKSPSSGEPRSIPKVLVGALGLLFPLLVLDVCYGLVVGIGLLLLIIPGVWLLVKYAFAPLLLVVEDESSFGALGRSSVLVKGRWFAVFWRWLVIFLFTVIPMMILPRMLGLLGSVVGSLFFAPFYSCALFTVLESLKETKETSPA